MWVGGQLINLNTYNAVPPRSIRVWVDYGRDRFYGHTVEAEIRELLVVRETGDCPCGPAETLLREHIGEINREIARLTALRAELSGMVAGLSVPSGPCPDPVPGTWCMADRQDTESNPGGGDRNVLVLR